jgi:hypothetical protein
MQMHYMTSSNDFMNNIAIVWLSFVGAQYVNVFMTSLQLHFAIYK